MGSLVENAEQSVQKIIDDMGAMKCIPKPNDIVIAHPSVGSSSIIILTEEPGIKVRRIIISVISSSTNGDTVLTQA